MKIMISIKRVIDYKVPIRIKPDHSGVETNNVKMSMNPFDEIAVEEAVRLKEKGVAKEIVAITIGSAACQEILRTALAMGADRAIHVVSDHELQPLMIAKILAKIAEQEKVSLAILGKQAIDNDDNQTGQMLAALLNWPQGTFASKLNFQDKTVSVTREIDGGLETLNLNLPAVITTDLRLNEPRYISLPNIVQAKRKPIETVALDTLGIAFKSHYQTLKVEAPEKRRNGIKLANASELVNKLRHDVQVIR